ncbi:hypothetical protein AB0F62_16790, partial [Streptomyces sp. NPDC026673]
TIGYGGTSAKGKGQVKVGVEVSTPVGSVKRSAPTYPGRRNRRTSGSLKRAKVQHTIAWGDISARKPLHP